MNDDANNGGPNQETASSTAGIGAPPPNQKDSPELVAAKEKLKALQEAARRGTTSTAATGTAITGKAQWTPQLAMNMGAGVFLFGVLLFAMVSVLVWKNKSVDSLLRIFGILLIILAAVFLMVAGYSDQQVAPVMGLLGTIAGYLLSRRTEPAPGAEATVPPKPTAPKPDASSAEPPVA
jgi:uncharacterized membrane protein YfcA